MDKPQPKTSGWFELVRRIGESVAALMRNRLELFTVELQEEKLRWLELLLWLGLAMAIGAAGILLAIAALALWLWTVAGYAGLIGLAVVTLAIAGGIVWAILRKIHTSPAPFAQTVAEFRKDGECLRGDN